MYWWPVLSLLNFLSLSLFLNMSGQWDKAYFPDGEIICEIDQRANHDRFGWTFFLKRTKPCRMNRGGSWWKWVAFVHLYSFCYTAHTHTQPTYIYMLVHCIPNTTDVYNSGPRTKTHFVSCPALTKGGRPVCHIYPTILYAKNEKVPLFWKSSDQLDVW